MATRTTEQKHDDELDEAEILKGVPALLPPEQLRQRPKSELLKLVNRMRGFMGEDGSIDMNVPAVADAALDMLADAEEFFETIAADRDAYVRWATGLKNGEQIFPLLLSRYGRAVGE